MSPCVVSRQRHLPGKEDAKQESITLRDSRRSDGNFGDGFPDAFDFVISGGDFGAAEDADV